MLWLCFISLHVPSEWSFCKCVAVQLVMRRLSLCLSWTGPRCLSVNFSGVWSGLRFWTQVGHREDVILLCWIVNYCGRREVTLVGKRPYCYLNMHSGKHCFKPERRLSSSDFVWRTRPLQMSTSRNFQRSKEEMNRMRMIINSAYLPITASMLFHSFLFFVLSTAIKLLTLLAFVGDLFTKVIPFLYVHFVTEFFFLFLFW